MKTVFENEFVKISETGRDYDFVAVIENKTDEPVIMVMDEDIALENAIEETFLIPANDWVGLCNWEYDGNTKQALLQGDYECNHRVVAHNSKLT